MPFFKQKDATVPPGQAVTTGFPVLHVGNVPRFDRATWRLRVFGLVDEPFALSFDELRALPSTEWRGDIHCVTRWSKKTPNGAAYCFVIWSNARGPTRE